MIHPDLHLIVYREQGRQRDRDLEYLRAAREHHEQRGTQSRSDLRIPLHGLTKWARALRTARHSAPVAAICCPA